MYYSFSSTPECPRFRICVVSDEVITDREERDRIQAGLASLFSQADTSCKNADRMYFGTDKGLCEGVGDLNTKCRKPDLLALIPAAKAENKEIEKSANFSVEVGAKAKENTPAKTGSAEELREKCAFINHCWNDAKTLSYPHWFGAISNIALTADGHDAVHEMSKTYPRYEYDETEQLYSNAIEVDKPQTCEYIKNKLGFDCGKNCGVKAPIALVHAKPIVWEEPIPLDETTAPSFPVDALPEAIRDYVSAVAESTQTPVDLSAVTALSVLSICNQGKFVVKPKADWTEGLNTYVLSIMPPSERKSAVCSHIAKPVYAYEREWNEAHAADINISEIDKEILTGKLEHLKDQRKKGKSGVTAEDVHKAAEELRVFKEVKRKKLCCDDVTPERLASVMAENGGVSAIFSSEGGIFDTLDGIYTKNVNINVVLKGYSLDRIDIERMGRKSETIYDPTLTVSLMAQPSVLKSVLTNKNFKGKGLTTRFLLCLPKSRIGDRKYRSQQIPKETYERYDLCIREMLEIDTQEKPKPIVLSREADDLLAAFHYEIEAEKKARFLAYGEDDSLLWWLGKIVGNTTRIAGLFCIASSFNPGHNASLVISGSIMKNAIAVGKYFFGHAKVAFSEVDETKIKCIRFLKILKEKNCKALKVRDAMRMWRSLKTAEEAQEVINILVECGYLAEKPGRGYSGKGRYCDIMYAVNPCIYAAG